MPLLALSNATMHFGERVLLDGVTLEVEPGAKIGVVGANGIGKSTLLKLLAGVHQPVSGSVTRGRGARVAYQAQELACDPESTVWDEMRRVFDAVHARDARLRALEERLAGGLEDDERRRVLLEYEALQHAHETAGGYDVDRRIETVLSSLGLPEEAWRQKIEVFSGGERNVIGLARVLLAEPDVMLLDEPSNHLDMNGVEWFVEFVRSSRAAVVMVSHNRHLLDATSETIWEAAGGKVVSWTGNYSDFQRQKAEARALQERQWKSQQRLIRRIEFAARRLKDMANAYDDPAQAKRAKVMMARIDRMEKVERPDDGGRGFRAEIRSGERHGRIAVSVRGFSFSYGDRPIFRDADLEIEQGERVCLVGRNGSGKTTLLKEILTRGSWENPTLRLGKSVRVGEYRQLHDDVLDLSATLLDWIQADTGLLRTPAAALLHRFLFAREDLDRPIGTLSGGEKSRLQLARLAHRDVNLLLLDEPTNHLDLQACEQLEETLEEYEGTLLVVSHDRYFLDKLVTRVVEVEDRRLVSHRETFAAWWARKAAERGGRKRAALELQSRKEAAEGDEGARVSREERKVRERDVRRLRSELKALETKIERLEARQTDLTARLERAWAPGGDRDAALALTKDVEGLRAELASLYAAWTTTAAALEPEA